MTHAVVMLPKYIETYLLQMIVGQQIFQPKQISDLSLIVNFIKLMETGPNLEV